MTLRFMHILALLLFTDLTRAQPLFDTHLHYSAQDAKNYSPQQVIQLLKQNDIRHAVVSGTPPKHTAELYKHAPQRIIPFLSAYRNTIDKENWHQDEKLPSYLERMLATGNWQGIGELHIFAKDRHSRVFHRVIQMATQYQLPLLIHGDPAVIDSIFETAASTRVLWAHAGTFPYPDLIDDYLTRYPNLYVDLSVRDAHIAPDGNLTDHWYNLFVKHPDRFLLGVDTYSPQRWQQYSEVSKTIRQWLSQLPPDIANKLVLENAEQLFRTKKPAMD